MVYLYSLDGQNARCRSQSSQTAGNYMLARAFIADADNTWIIKMLFSFLNRMLIHPLHMFIFWDEDAAPDHGIMRQYNQFKQPNTHIHRLPYDWDDVTVKINKFLLI
jgi:hypothetical protein